MAISPTYNFGPTRNMRGQGAVEAIVVLPVFLILIGILFQLFLVAIAQVQLRYASFCAARVGAVHNADVKEMSEALDKVLSGIPGYALKHPGSYWVELLDPVNEQDLEEKVTSRLLKIRVHWDFPLLIPLINTLLTGFSGNHPFKETPTVSLQSTWTTVLFDTAMGKNDENK